MTVWVGDGGASKTGDYERESSSLKLYRQYIDIWIIFKSWPLDYLVCSAPYFIRCTTALAIFSIHTHYSLNGCSFSWVQWRLSNLFELEVDHTNKISHNYILNHTFHNHKLSYIYILILLGHEVCNWQGIPQIQVWLQSLKLEGLWGYFASFTWASKSLVFFVGGVKIRLMEIVGFIKHVMG